MTQPNKTILITGAAGNLGSVVTRHFLNSGFRVMATVAHVADIQEAAGHPHLSVSVVDLTDEKAANDWVQEAIAQQQDIEGALLLAGGFTMGRIADTGSADIKQQIALNFDTAYHVARPLLAHFKEKGSGKLVFVGAKPALLPEAGKDMLPYALSKSLLFQLAEYINAETKSTGVTASVLVPSTIDTPANRAAMPDAPHQDWVHPQALAEMMSFLLTDTASALRQTVLKAYNNA